MGLNLSVELGVTGQLALDRENSHLKTLVFAHALKNLGEGVPGFGVEGKKGYADQSSISSKTVPAGIVEPTSAEILVTVPAL